MKLLSFEELLDGKKMDEITANRFKKDVEFEKPKHISEEIKKIDIEFITGEINASFINNDEIQYSPDDDMFCICPILCLPRELLLQIFTYISQKQLCNSISRVCKLWHEYAFDPSLWKTINLQEYPDLSSVDLCRLILKATNLGTLILHGRDNVSESEVAVFTQYTPHLKFLDLGFCHSVNESILEIIVNQCKILEGINLEGITVSVWDLCRCQHLKRMNFSHCRFQNEDINQLVENLDKIVSLNVDGVYWIEEETIMYLAQHHHESLEELSIDGSEITDICYKDIANCNNLTVLESSFCELLTDKSLIYLQNLFKLKKLRLRKGRNFSVDGLKSLFSSAAVTHLTSLDLSECAEIDDSFVIQLAKSCGKTLQNLMLRWCWFVTDIGTISIVDNCSNMVHLDLTGIHEIYGECFGRIPTEMIHLKLLNLEQCNRVNDELIESLVRKKKDLKVINYFGEEFQYDSS